MAEPGSIRDLIVIGAGPAGMAAAIAASDLGLDVLVLDEQAEPGGQIYRAVGSVARTRPEHLDRLGRTYQAGAALTERFAAVAVAHLDEATVWNLEDGQRVFFSQRGRSSVVTGRFVLIATGAQERPRPFPGWTLPGVMGVGGLQSALKLGGVVPTGRIVLAGSGPLLLQLVAQYAALGVKLAGVLDTTPAGTWRRALPRLPKALLAADDLAKGVQLLARLRATGTPIRRHVTDLAALGTERVEKVRFASDGVENNWDCDLLAVHEGVVPNVQLTRAIEAEHVWHEEQRCFRPRLDGFGQTSVATVFVAGDGAGIGGARAAELQGEIAVLEIAHRLGRIDQAERDRGASGLGRAWRRHLAIRPLLDALYPPPATLGELADEVMVCRCEEVTAGRIRSAVEGGAMGPNQVKAFTRCGMGPCQGRMCGLTVTELIAAARGVGPEAVGYYRIRPPLKPLALAELASLAEPTELP